MTLVIFMLIITVYGGTPREPTKEEPGDDNWCQVVTDCVQVDMDELLEGKECGDDDCAEYCENQAKARDVSPCAAYWTGDGFDEPARYLSEDDERAYRLAFFRPYNAQNMTQQAARPITVEEDENDETSDTEDAQNVVMLQIPPPDYTTDQFIPHVHNHYPISIENVPSTLGTKELLQLAKKHGEITVSLNQVFKISFDNGNGKKDITKKITTSTAAAPSKSTSLSKAQLEKQAYLTWKCCVPRNDATEYCKWKQPKAVQKCVAQWV